MVWLTGLSLNVLVCDVKVLFVYPLLVGLALTIFTGLTFANPLRAMASVILFVPA